MALCGRSRTVGGFMEIWWCFHFTQAVTQTKHWPLKWYHYNDVIMSTMTSQITSFAIVYSTVYLMRISKKTSTPRVTGLCEGNSPLTGGFRHKGSVTRKMFPFDDVIMLHALRRHLLAQLEVPRNFALSRLLFQMISSDHTHIWQCSQYRGCYNVLYIRIAAT